jgi:hypothetical protein
MHVACVESRSGTDLRAGEEEVVAGLFALHYAIDHGLLLPAQVLDFGANPFLEVVDTPTDLDMPSEFQSAGSYPLANAISIWAETFFEF